MAHLGTITPKKKEVLNPGRIERDTRRILVTGGCGFVGSHLVSKLMEDPLNEVFCVDNCFSGRKANIAQFADNPRFEFIRHDVEQPLHLEVDQIYHLACPASPVFYQHDGVKTIRTGVLGTMNMLELARTTGARFLISSTSEVYGDPSVHPQKESYWGNVNPIGVRSCYDESKRLAEALAFEFWRTHGVTIRVARIFNTYGPQMLENDGRVVSNFIMQALEGKALTVYGDGSQTRSFCYVSDLVEGLIRLMNNEKTQGPVNLGNPNEYSILQLAQTIQEQVNPDVQLVHKPMPSDDPKRRQPDITRARVYLDGWEPTVQLKEGLTHTIDYFRTYLADKKARHAQSKRLRSASGAAAAASAPKARKRPRNT